jgi:hypothetical protein
MGIGPLFTLDRRAGERIGDPEGGEAFVQLSGSLAGCGKGGAVKGETVDSAASATGFEILGRRCTYGCASGQLKPSLTLHT